MNKKQEDLLQKDTESEQEEIVNSEADNGDADALDARSPSEDDVSEDDELANALAQVEAFKAALQRERADFQNYKKRMEREKTELASKLRGDVFAKVLPIADDFERALDGVPAEERENDWLKGIVLIHKKLNTLITNEGIETIDPLGEVFDPNYHEAIGADEPSDEFESGQVTVVLQKGYIQGERVLRPAMVRVAN